MLLGSAYGKVSLDASGVKAGVGQATASLKSLQEAGQMAGQAMQSVGNAMTIGLTLPIVAAGTAAIKFASDLNETKTKTEQIFGSMSDDIMQWAETANTSLGMTRQQAMDAADTFAMFGQAAGKSGDDLTDFAKANTQLATDFASFYNTSPEDAIMAIGAAYRGETEPIRRYNILLNDQVLKQKAAAMGIYDGNGALSIQQRILAVNKVLAEQSGAAMGDFARTSGGLANQTRILNAQFHDSLVMLGQNLLPVAVQFVTTLNGMLTAFQAMPVPMQMALLAFAGFLAVLGPVISGIGTLLMFVVSLSQAWPVLTAGAAAMGVVLPSLSAGFAAVGTAIMGAGSALLAFLAPIAVVLPAVGILVAAWNSDFLGFQTNIKNMSYQIPIILKVMWDDAVAYFSSINWMQMGTDIVTGIISGISNAAGALYQALVDLATNALAAAKAALGIASPSKKFAYLGEMSGLGYMQALTKSTNPAEIARTLARPVQNNSTSQSVTQVQNFGGGLSIREARRMQAEQEKRMMKTLAYAFGN